MSESVLLCELDEGIATLTLNRPKALNALSAELRGAIARAFLELRGNPEVGTVILTGSGRAFCAGVDLKEMATDLVQPGGNEFRIDDSGMMRALREFDRPVIGAIHGFAITGGFELALMCDVLIASSEARFADTHARVGVLPGWGLSQKLPRLIGISRAKELSFTGNYIDAEQALAWGLVNRVVAPEELLPTCRSLALDMLSCDPRARCAQSRRRLTTASTTASRRDCGWNGSARSPTDATSPPTRSRRGGRAFRTGAVRSRGAERGAA